MFSSTLRLDPAFEGEVSLGFYGKSNEALNRVAQRVAYNGYSTNGKNFIKRNGFHAIYRSSNRLFTFTIDQNRIGLIEEKDETSVYFTPYSTATGFKLQEPAVANFTFDKFSKYNELNFRSGEDLIFSVQGGLFSVDKDHRLVPILTVLDDVRINQVFSVPASQNNLGYFSYTAQATQNTFTQNPHPLANTLLTMAWQTQAGTQSHNFASLTASLTEVQNAGLYTASMQKIVDDYIAGLKVGLSPGTTVDLVNVIFRFYLDYGANNTLGFQGGTISVSGHYELVNFTYTYKVATQFVGLTGVTDFSKTVFFNNRLLIFFNNSILYSSTANPYDFSSTAVTDRGFLDKTAAGSLDFLKFYSTNGGITNVVSISEFVVFTTKNITYEISMDANSPVGLRVRIISNEGAVENGMIVLGHEIYKLSEFGLKKLVNYQYYSQLQEIDATLYQPHIYHHLHTNLSYSRYKCEKYIFTLRDDGVVFCHTTIPVGLASEYAYYILTSRIDNKYFQVTQIAKQFLSGICKLKFHWGDTNDNILFIYKNFDFNNDNMLAHSLYSIKDLNNYYFLDLGVTDNTTLYNGTQVTKDYTLDEVNKRLAIKVPSLVINNKLMGSLLAGHTNIVDINDPFHQNKFLEVGQLFKFNDDVWLKILEYTSSTLTVDISPLYTVVEGAKTKIPEFLTRIRNKKCIALNGRRYGAIETKYLDILKNVYKVGEPITKELKTLIDAPNGDLQLADFNLYPTPDEFTGLVEYNVDGCYFAIGLPYDCYLGVHVNALDMNAIAKFSIVKCILTTNLEIRMTTNECDYQTNYNQLQLHKLTHKISVPNSAEELKDCSNLDFRAKIGEFLSILSFVIHI